MMPSKVTRNSASADPRFCYAWVAGTALALILLFTSSCGTTLFKVKPVSQLTPMPPTVASADLGSISFRAAPMLTDEESQEMFEANLQLAGLLPVRVEIMHNGGEPIELRKVRFRLTDGAGTKWKTISAKQAITRILKANDIFLYSPSSRKTFEQEFRAYDLDLKAPLTKNEGRREGLVIFLAADKAPVSSPRGLVLTIEGFAQPVTLNLK